MSTALILASMLVLGQGASPDSLGEAVIKGEARLSCTAGGDGSLQACGVLSEAPSGQGFGTAAVARAGQLTIKPARDGGPSKGKQLTLPMRFEFTPPEAAGAGIVAPGVPETIKTGEWLSRPTGADLARRYPKRAAARGVSGRARVICRAQADGTLSDCTVLEESPIDYGFGEAVRLLATQSFRLKPLDKEGRAVAGRLIVVPVIMQMSY